MSDVSSYEQDLAQHYRNVRANLWNAGNIYLKQKEIAQIEHQKAVEAEIIQLRLEAQKRFLSIAGPAETIAKIVADDFGLTFQQITGLSRMKFILRPRLIAMYLCRQTTNLSFTQIGKKFHRDHSTVISGVRRISLLLAKDMELANRIEALRIKCQTKFA